jgi:UDP-2,3-diacylglucosamine pyrophosphatase LpxH
MTKIPVRSIFISDVHLGLKQSNAEELLEFLKRYKWNNLFILGDFFDGYKLKRKFYWDKHYSYLLRYIIGKIKDGKRVVYVSGNHDDFLRQFDITDLGHIEVVDEYIHETEHDKVLLIHGDKFDMAIHGMKWLYWLGSIGYDFLLWFNGFWEKACWLFRLPRRSLSKYIKHKVKATVSFITSFETVITKYAHDKNCDVVISGHIHTPSDKEIDGVQYLNCGDWVESNSAVVEYTNGEFEVVYYNEK